MEIRSKVKQMGFFLFPISCEPLVLCNDIGIYYSPVV